MITLKNSATNEIVKCSYTRIDSTGRVYYRNADNGGKQPTDKFLSARGLTLTGENAEINGVTAWYMTIGAGWEIVNGKPARTEKPKPAPKPTDGAPEPKPEPKNEPAPVPEPKKERHNAPKPEPKNGGDALAKAIAAAIADYIPNTPQPEHPTTERHEFNINGADLGNVDGLLCKEFNRILTRCYARIPVYLYGAAGCGKSHTAEQIATALKLPFYAQMQLVNKYDIIGFVDAGGVFQSTPFYHAYKNGGVILFDEYDRGDASAIITLNGALANGYVTFPNGERVTKHKNFVFVAAGNTNGLGATSEYNTAATLDASSIDRPAFIKMNYDARLENEFSKFDPNFAEFIRDLRNAVKVCGVDMICSYRPILNIAKIWGCGDSREILLQDFVIKGRDNDTAATLYGALKDKTNPWAKALQNIALGKCD